ncbi:MAG: OmpA family protein [Deltaproteobacteria bacterium]|nr:OmpA family protein [Deltaproteobacteria bacterium]
MIKNKQNNLLTVGNEATLRALRWLPALLLLLVFGCATTGLTRQDALRQYEPIARLNDDVEDFRGKDSALLAPILFGKTEAELNEAIELALKADKNGAIAAAERGLSLIEELNKELSKNKTIMEEVIDIRARAIVQGAAVLSKEAFDEADDGFRSVSRLLEQGKVQDGKKERSGLIELYAKLELDALKKGTIAAAKKAISSAENADADKYAPKTLQSAREELKLAVSVLEADRTQVEKGNHHAKQAVWFASRANEITNLNKYFETQEFSDEDIVLWYQAQLQRVRDALQLETLPFDESNSRVIQTLQTDAHALKAVMKDMRHTNELTREQIVLLEKKLVTQRKKNETELQQILAVHEQQFTSLTTGNRAQKEQAEKESQVQIEALRQRLSVQALANAENERKELRAKERFVQTQQLFDAAEADVFRQGDNVLIRLKGFTFSPGKYVVEASNYALLNKVVAAINTFPASKVAVTGHTDARGSDKRNIELSAARAQSVVEFLSTVGGVAAHRLSSKGKGEEQPVASNDNSGGRAENRRIDLLIVNTAPTAPTGSAL